MRTLDYVKLATTIEVGKEKDEKFYLLKGILRSFNSKEICGCLDLGFKQPILFRKLILERILEDIKKQVETCHFKLFDSLLNSFNNGFLTYHQKEACSVFIYEIAIYMPPVLVDKAINDFANSNYVNDRGRAMDLIDLFWQDKYKNLLVDLFNNFGDGFNLMIDKLSPEFLFSKLNQLLKYLGDDLENDFDLRVLRNKLFIKIHKYIPEKIDEIKNSDPISYIFIKKEIGEKIKAEYALDVYKKFPRSRRYLPVWYGEMKQRSALNKIIIFLNKKADDKD